MSLRLWSIFASAATALMLAGCGDTPPDPEGAARDNPVEAATSPTVGEVVGPERRILAFGDSLFAGYGLKKGEGYPAQLEAALRARGVNARVSDAGVSGDTTAAGLQRIGFVIDNEAAPPELAIVELGGNDLLRSIPPAETRKNLAAILDELKKRKIPVLLMGMRAPPNLGAQFVAEFDGIYPALAKEYGAQLVPFFQEAVYDQPRLIQQDRIHPTAEGISAMAAATVGNVEQALPPVLPPVK